MSDGHIKNKTKEQILIDLPGTANVGSPVHEQQKMAIVVRCVEDLEHQLSSLTKTIDESNKSSAELSKKVYSLNVTLTAATWVAGIAGAIGAFIAFLHLMIYIGK